MNVKEPDFGTIDWTAVDRAVQDELLGRAKRVAPDKNVAGGTDRVRKPGPDDPTDEAPPVG